METNSKTSVKRVPAGVAALAAAAVIAAVGFAYIQSSGTRYENAVEAGEAYAGQQQYDLAIEAFETALDLQEDDLATRILLLESLAGAGDYDAVETFLTESVVFLTQEEYGQLRQSAAEILAEDAGAAAASGDTDTAVELYEKVLELADEGSAAAQNAEEQLEDLYLQQAARTSLELYAAVLERDPDNTDALWMTAQLYESLGEYELAISCYEQLPAEDGSEAIARCWRGIASGRTGSAAIAAWEESLLWDPCSEDAYLALADLYLSEEDVQSATSTLSEGLSLMESEAMQSLYDEIYVSDFEQLVIQIIENITTDDMTAEEKRLACYQYIIDTTTYVRTYEQPSGDWTKEYALDVLATQQGNCFRYAAAFAYMCAELGYDAKVCTGEVSAASGGTTPHGWVVLTIDGAEYYCDPDLEQSLGYDFYMKSYEAYPVKPLITEEEWEIAFD